MEIKRLYNDNEFDIFLGSGWENWIRVKVSRNKQVECLAKAEHVQLNDKLAELIYYKTRRYS